MIGSLNHLKNLVSSQETGSEPIKNISSKIFVNPNSTAVPERRALGVQSPKEMNEGSSDKFSSYLASHFGLPEANMSHGYSNALGLTPKSVEHNESILGRHLSQSVNDALGKRQDPSLRGFDQDLPMHDPLLGSKRRVGEKGIDRFVTSPTMNFDLNRQRSNPASPAHSFNGGFKLHSSRKNSDLMELGSEFKLQPIKKTADDISSHKT